MSETTVNAYATKSDNTAATTPTPVAVVNDGTGDRQIVVLGKGDGTSGIVDGSTANPVNVAASSLPLPTGAATSANQTTGNTSLSTIATNTANAGTPTVSGTITANAGTNLNTSALALETGGNLASAKTDLDTIVTNTNKIPALGQALAAASVPVILPSATVTTLTPPAAITNFANETGGNLAAIKADTDKIPSQGQALAASSMPVVLTAAQIAAMTLPTDGNGYVDVNIQTNSAGIAKETGGNLATIATQTSGLSTSANQTNGTQQTKITNGTNIADVVAGDTGFNGVATASATKTYTFTTSSSGAQTILANTPTEGFSWIEVVYTSVGSGLALTGGFCTASGGTYVTSSAWFPSNSTNPSPGALGTSANVIYSGPVKGNFFQIAVSALTSGTFTGTVTLRAVAPPATGLTNQVAQNGIWTVGSNSATGSAPPANAFYIGVNDGTNLRGITTNSTTYTSKYGADSNLLGTLGTAFTTAGFVDVKGADGNVFVRQTTGSNLHVVADSGSTTAVTQGTAANLNATVVGTGTFAVQSTTAVSTSGGVTSWATGSIGNTATSIKASAGNVYSYYFYNNNSAVSYVQWYNTASGSVTVGTTPPVRSMGIPAYSAANLSYATPLSHGTAIVIAVTTTRAGATSPTNTVDYNVEYN